LQRKFPPVNALIEAGNDAVIVGAAAWALLEQKHKIAKPPSREMSNLLNAFDTIGAYSISDFLVTEL